MSTTCPPDTQQSHSATYSPEQEDALSFKFLEGNVKTDNRPWKEVESRVDGEGIYEISWEEPTFVSWMSLCTHAHEPPSIPCHLTKVLVQEVESSN